MYVAIGDYSCLILPIDEIPDNMQSLKINSNNRFHLNICDRTFTMQYKHLNCLLILQPPLDEIEENGLIDCFNKFRI